MRRLKDRIAEIEARVDTPAKLVACILQYQDQTQDDAVAAYEAENGPINHGGVLRVFINKPFQAPRHA